MHAYAGEGLARGEKKASFMLRPGVTSLSRSSRQNQNLAGRSGSHQHRGATALRREQMSTRDGVRSWQRAMQDVVVGAVGSSRAAAACQHYNSNNANSAIAGMWGSPSGPRQSDISAQTMNSQPAPHTQLAPSGPQMQPGVLPGRRCCQAELCADAAGPVPQMSDASTTRHHKPRAGHHPDGAAELFARSTDYPQKQPSSPSPRLHANSRFWKRIKLADEAQKVQKMIDLKQHRVAAENDDDEDQITVRQGK